MDDGTRAEERREAWDCPKPNAAVVKYSINLLLYLEYSSNRLKVKQLHVLGSTCARFLSIAVVHHQHNSHFPDMYREIWTMCCTGQ